MDFPSLRFASFRASIYSEDDRVSSRTAKKGWTVTAGPITYPLLLAVTVGPGSTIVSETYEE